MLTTPIRQILEIPEQYRVIPIEEARRRKQKKRTPPAPSQELLDRQKQLANAGIKAKMKYDSRTRSYCLAFRIAPGGEVPEWQ